MGRLAEESCFMIFARRPGNGKHSIHALRVSLEIVAKVPLTGLPIDRATPSVKSMRSAER